MTVDKLAWFTNRNSKVYGKYYMIQNPKLIPLFHQPFLHYSAILFWLDTPAYVYRWNTLQCIIEFISEELAPDVIISLDDIEGTFKKHENIIKFQGDLLAKSKLITSGAFFDTHKMYRNLINYHANCNTPHCNSPHYQLTRHETDYRNAYGQESIHEKWRKNSPSKFANECPNYSQSGNCFFQDYCRFHHNRCLIKFKNKFQSKNYHNKNEDEDSKLNYTGYEQPTMESDTEERYYGDFSSGRIVCTNNNNNNNLPPDFYADYPESIVSSERKLQHVPLYQTFVRSKKQALAQIKKEKFELEEENLDRIPKKKNIREQQREQQRIKRERIKREKIKQQKIKKAHTKYKKIFEPQQASDSKYDAYDLTEIVDTDEEAAEYPFDDSESQEHGLNNNNNNDDNDDISDW